MTLYKWSQTAASDATADSTINWAEGQSPSSVNDSARAMMAATAKYRDDIAGAIVTGGSATAFTVTSYQVFDTLAHLSGQMIAFTPHATNTGSSGCTLNVDGLGAKSIRSSPNVELPSGSLILGTPYVVTYNNSDACFYLQGGVANAYSIPLGGGLTYWGATAPNSAFAFPAGQAISRTTYATMFALVGSSFGGGDGSTTFNLPDVTGRTLAMKEASATRLTSTYFGGDSTVIGAAGGVEKITMAQANMPNVQLAVTGSLSVASSVSDILRAPGGVINAGFGTGGGTGIQYLNTQTGATQQITSTGSLASGLTASINGGTTQTLMNNVQPTMVCNYIIRVI